MPIPFLRDDPRESSSEPSRLLKKAKMEYVPDLVEDYQKLLEEQMSLPMESEQQYQHPLDYRDKLVLAPMVRTGTLPTRLLSIFYGAGLVWSPEIVDRAIIGAERIVDAKSGVITYSKGQGTIFSTHLMEKPYLIFQIGSSNPDLALQAAQTVQQDVAGFDLNCGCPKPFSTHSGMGAALLSTPDVLLDILRQLIKGTERPVSCKIRLLPNQPSTLLLASRILRTGISNLTVHCRTRNMRSQERALWERLRDIVELGERRGVPVVCNGDGEGWSNWEQIRAQTGANSVMLARAAERNPSIFCPSGPKCNVTEVIPRLLNIAEYFDHSWGNVKFLLSQFKPSAAPVSLLTKQQKKAAQEAVMRSKSIREVAESLDVRLGRGEEVLREIQSTLEGRNGFDPFKERRAAEREDRIVDENIELEEALLNRT